MTAKATTFRLDPDVKARLSMLSGLVNKSLNQLANEAIREFVARRSREVETDLEATLEDLRAYRERDPDFQHAIDDLIASEAALSPEDDPAEGQVISETALPSDKTPGPTERKVLGLLDG